MHTQTKCCGPVEFGNDSVTWYIGSSFKHYVSAQMIQYSAFDEERIKWLTKLSEFCKNI